MHLANASGIFYNFVLERKMKERPYNLLDPTPNPGQNSISNPFLISNSTGVMAAPHLWNPKPIYNTPPFFVSTCFIHINKYRSNDLCQGYHIMKWDIELVTQLG